MLKTKCYACQAEIVFPAGKDLVRCEFCTRMNDRPKSKKEASDRMKLANERRNAGEFDEAAGLYMRVLEENMQEHEARWGLVLCRRGVIYVENDDGKCIPTCRRVDLKPLSEDPDFIRACQDAAEDVRAQYLQDGKYIADIQREIRKLQMGGGKYDVFICYKDSDPNEKNGHTRDRKLALNLYQRLGQRGFNVFYAPISLKDHLGANYEAAIFHAIETSRVMLVLGTKKEYFNATWVRSEWRRFLDRYDAGENRLLIPLYRDIHADDLPDAFTDRFLQGLDMGDIGFVFDLEANITKVLKLPEEEKPVETVKVVEKVIEKVVEKVIEVEKPAPDPKPEEKKIPPEAAEDKRPGAEEEFAQFERLARDGSSAEERRRALEHLEKAAGMGLHRAMNRLAGILCYEWEDYGAQADRVRATELYRQTAQQGDPEGMVELAACYQLGYGVAEDPQEAFRWLEKGHRLGSAEATYELSRAYWYGEGVKENRRKSAELLKQAAAAGSPAAMQRWGNALLYGPKDRLYGCEGVEKDVEEAARMFAAGAEKQHSGCMIDLGGCYERGEGVEQSYEKAYELYRGLAEQHTIAAMERVGWMFAHGKGVAADGAEAVKWLEEANAQHEEALERPSETACVELGRLYAEGVLVKKDAKRAKKWLHKLDGAENAEAQALMEKLDAPLVPDDGRTEYEKWIAVVGEDWFHVSARGTAQERRGAVENLKVAAEKGWVAAMCDLACLLRLGMKAFFVEKDEARSVQLYQKAADAGDPRGMAGLGYAYYYGSGVEKDYARSAQWYQKGADLGDGECMVGLAKAYQYGYGVEKSGEKFRTLLEQAVDAGYARAAWDLGYAYESGYALPQNMKMAAEWYKRGLEMGDAIVKPSLARLYAAGQGVKQDYAMAVKLYSEHPCGASFLGMGKLYVDGLGVEKDYAKGHALIKKAADAGVSEAKEWLASHPEPGWDDGREEYEKWIAVVGEDWYSVSPRGTQDERRKAAENLIIGAQKGWADAMHDLARCRERGSTHYFIEKDQAEAMRLYKALADRNDGRGMAGLGDLYGYGWGVEQDHVQSVKWYRKGAELGNGECMVGLAKAYKDGEGVPKDHAKHVELLEKAVDAGYAKAAWELGYAHRYGFGAPKDPVKAAGWHKRSIDMGYMRSKPELAEMYEKGEGVKKDCAMAAKLYSEHPCVASDFGLGRLYVGGLGVEKDVDKGYALIEKAAKGGASDAKEWLKKHPKPKIDAKAEYAKWRAVVGENWPPYNARGSEEEQRAAVKHLELAAKNGLAIAKADWARCLYSGKAVEKDEERAEEIFRELAEQGDVRGMEGMGCVCRDRYEYSTSLQWYEQGTEKGDGACMLGLAKAYKYGEGVEKDPKLFEHYCERAVEAGYGKGAYELARAYKDGTMGIIDLGRTVYWYKRGAEMEDPSCKVMLAELYLKGEGVEQDYAMAAKLFGEWDCPLSDAGLGYMYAEGLGVERDFFKGVELMKKAADCEPAKDWLKPENRYAAWTAVAGERFWDANTRKKVFDDFSNLTEDCRREALENLRIAAEGGLADAQADLGCVLASNYNWFGVEKDEKLAFELFEKAAEQNHPGGIVGAARCYKNGCGVAEDREKAIEWLKKGKDMPEAMFELAWLYRDVKDSDKYKAKIYLASAVRKDYPPAYFQMGQAFEWGEEYRGSGNLKMLKRGSWPGIDKDLTKAVEHYRRGAELGDGYCIQALKRLGKDDSPEILYREWVAVRTDEGASEEACRAAFAKLKKAAEAGYAPAQCAMGRTLQSQFVVWRYGVSKDDKAGFEWLSKAEKQDYAEAAYALALCYRFGHGTQQNEKEYMRLLNRAIALGSGEAMREMADLHRDGKGVEKSGTKVLQWLNRAIDAGDEYALCELGRVYRTGVVIPHRYGRQKPEADWSVPKDLAKAVKLFERGVEKGDSSCCNELADMYEKGEGVPQSWEKAARLYEKVTGSSRGAYRLGWMYANGKGVAQDGEKAVELLSRVGPVIRESCYELGKLYAEGKLVAYDPQKAIEALEKANSPDAKYLMGMLYLKGEAMTPDPKKALELVAEAAKGGCVEAKRIYEAEVGLIGLLKKEKAASSSRIAMELRKQIADFYEQGIGVQQDRDEAAKWRAGASHVDADGEITDSWTEIFKAIDSGEYRERYAVGNTKALDLGPEGVVHMQIAAFDTDERADGKGKAPITWISRELLKNERRMNPELEKKGFFRTTYVAGTSAIGGWEHCELRAALQKEVWPLVPAEVRGRILEVKKQQKALDEKVNNFAQTTRDRLWIPDDNEVFGDDEWDIDVGYPGLFSDAASRVKKNVGSSSASWWWLRSAYITYYIDGVGSDGSFGSYYANTSGGLALGFCT